ncbi:MAG: hypothetical protein L0Y76_08625 [Ignavibacteria bacterium]|nr:hypothetical protein [Ignavibacteria bacterium]
MFDYFDILANAAGAAAGMLTIMIIIRRKIKLTTIK